MPRFTARIFLPRQLAAVLLTTLLLSCTRLMHSPAGTPGDIAYAQQLWTVLAQEQMVGKHAKLLQPFIGAARPHGAVLEVDSRMITVAGHNGFVIVKKNYRGNQLSVDDVIKDRAKYLSSISVMFQREAGYDRDNQNWFWVQYQPDGQLTTLHRMGMEIAMAGRMMKGDTPDKNQGCIYCHRSAGGGDYIFYPEITLP